MIMEGNIVPTPNGWSPRRPPPVKVELGAPVRVVGDLIFEHPVELRIHDSATVGDVIGDDVTVIVTVEELMERGNRARLSCICRVEDTIVLEGEALVKVPGRDEDGALS